MLDYITSGTCICEACAFQGRGFHAPGASPVKKKNKCFAVSASIEMHTFMY